MSEGHVYITRQLTPGVMRQVDRLDVPVRVNPDPDWSPSHDELLTNSVGAKALVTLLTDRVDAEVLDAAGPNLRVVANVAVGYDNIDLDTAHRRDVVVANTPGVLDEATADLTVGLILASSRRIVEGDRF